MFCFPHHSLLRGKKPTTHAETLAPKGFGFRFAIVRKAQGDLASEESRKDLKSGLDKKLNNVISIWFVVQDIW